MITKKILQERIELLEWGLKNPSEFESGDIVYVIVDSKLEQLTVRSKWIAYNQYGCYEWCYGVAKESEGGFYYYEANESEISKIEE